MRHAEAVSGVPHESEPAVWGCAGGCYFRTDFFLRLRSERPHLLSEAAVQAARSLFICRFGICEERAAWIPFGMIAAAMICSR